MFLSYSRVEKTCTDAQRMPISFHAAETAIHRLHRMSESHSYSSLCNAIPMRKTFLVGQHFYTLLPTLSMSLAISDLVMSLSPILLTDVRANIPGFNRKACHHSSVCRTTTKTSEYFATNASRRSSWKSGSTPPCSRCIAFLDVLYYSVHESETIMSHIQQYSLSAPMSRCPYRFSYPSGTHPR